MMPDTKTPFTINDRGVFYQDDQGSEWICSRLEVIAYVRDTSSENWGRLLSFHDADQQPHRWAMPMTALKGNGDELRCELLRLGLQIAPGWKARQRLLEYLIQADPPTRVRGVNRLGWHQHVFVRPHQTIGKTDECVLYQPEHIHHSPPTDLTAGTLADWQQNIGRRCVGNTRLVLAVSAALAGFLLHPADVESGGLHFVGESSCGKTTALKVAASVLGTPDTLQRWRATTNGLEAIAARHADSLLILDEIAPVDPKDAGEMAYLLANGCGKVRANKHGKARQRETWRLLFLSAGETGLNDVLRQIGKSHQAGQAVRLIDLPADASKGYGIFETLHGFTSGAELSHQLTYATSRYYGTAAIAFLEHITQDTIFAQLPHRLQPLIIEFMDRYQPKTASGQVHHVCERFALIAAAGRLATEYNITLWPHDEAEQAAAHIFQAWLTQRGHTGNQEAAAFLTRVQAFFEAHGTSRFEDVQATTPNIIHHRVGFRRHTASDHTEYFILPQMFREVICQGVDPRWAARILLQARMLMPSSEGKAQSTHRIRGEGVKKCYHFVSTTPC